jgi:hypothetical protein
VIPGVNGLFRFRMPLKCSRLPSSGIPGNPVRSAPEREFPNEKRFEREKKIGKQLQGKNINILTIE